MSLNGHRPPRMRRPTRRASRRALWPFIIRRHGLRYSTFSGAAKRCKPLDMNPLDTSRRAQAFRELHRGPGILVLPNPWDAGSARLFENLGFRALATTSAGLAFSL